MHHADRLSGFGIPLPAKARTAPKDNADDYSEMVVVVVEADDCDVAISSKPPFAAQ